LIQNIIALLDAIRSFLEDLDDTHLNAFLADWPPANFPTRSSAAHILPVVSWMPEVVKAAGNKEALIVEKLASLANHIARGQTYISRLSGTACDANGNRAAAGPLSLARR